MKTRKRQIIKLSLMITLTFTFFLTEVICGHITGSLALIGDSYHMISDVLALCIGLSCVVISIKSSKQNTFGWARAEILGALFNAIFLTTLCFTIFIEAVERLIHPHEIHEPDMLLIVGCVGLGVNLLGILMFCNEAHGHSHDLPAHPPLANGHLPRHSKASLSPVVSDQPSDSLSNGMYTIVSTVSEEKDKVDRIDPDGELILGRGDTDYKSSRVDCGGEDLNCLELHEKQVDRILNRSDGLIAMHDNNNKKKKIHSAGQMNIRGVFLHILGDALGSLVVITSALIVKYCEGEWTLRVDPVLSLVMICIILSTTFPLLRQSSLILLQHAPSHILPSELLDKISTKIPGLLGIHELHVWQLVGSRNVASMHVKCTDAESYETVAGMIRSLLHDEGVHSTTIQPEFIKNSSPSIEECTMECQADDSCSEDRCCISVRKRANV